MLDNYFIGRWLLVLRTHLRFKIFQAFSKFLDFTWGYVNIFYNGSKEFIYCSYLPRLYRIFRRVRANISKQSQ